MSNQFDALLDFGDDPPPSSNGTSQNANCSDDFDPFGASPFADSGKAGSGGDGGLLLDFSVTTEVNSTTENGTASGDPFDSQFTINSSSDFINNDTTATTNSNSNPFSDMSTTETQPSANPLYDLMDDDSFGQQQEVPDSTPSANPLYDLSATDSDVTFETNVTTTTTTQEDSNLSANPLYDLMDSEGGEVEMTTTTKTEPASSMDDFLGLDIGSGGGGESAVMEKSTPCGDIMVEANDNYIDNGDVGGGDQIVPDLALQQEAGPRETTPEQEEEEAGFDQNVELFIREDDEGQVEGRVADVDEDVVEVAAELDVGEKQVPQQEEEEVEQELEPVPVPDPEPEPEPELVPEPEPKPQQQQEEEEEVLEEVEAVEVMEEPEEDRPCSRHSISSEGEVLNEEEELRQDGVSLYKTREDKTFNETRYGGQPSQSFDSTFSGTHQGHGLENGNVAREQRQSATMQQPWEDEPEEGVYENEPEQRRDVARESDRDVGAELPSVGAAKSLRDKFLTGQVENRSTVKREVAPPAPVEGGVFENQPQYNPDVVHYGEEVQSEALPEQGTARNLAARFKELEKQGSVPVPSGGKREITPDRTGKVEFVSEPRGYVEKYEPQVQAGVFESQPAQRDDVVKSDQLTEEVLPERGAAKNIAQRFKQMSTETSASVPRGKREITPDYTSRVEYVSEPTSHVERYEGRPEAGVFESQPADMEGVVKSDQLPADILPEVGTARNIAARFKEMEKTTKSPPSPSKYKEFTPPRENGVASSAGVFENTPHVASDVVHSGEQPSDVLPEKGTAKNIANRFRQLSSSESTDRSPRAKKEFTPPPAAGSGVYENKPKQFVPDYNRPAESGILENNPEVRTDVSRGDEPPPYEKELPERGCTRNLVSAWRQRESNSAKMSPEGSAKPKEFTPPREEPRVAQQRPAPRTPKSPMAGMTDGSVHPTDLPGQYQPQAEPTVFESEPDRRDDVVREDDTDWNAGMPRSDTTKKMLAKFQHIQAEAAAKESPARPTPQARKEVEDNNSCESTPEKVGRSKSMRVAVQLEKCGACQKTVYAMEKIEIEKHAYHKSCFRCSHCHCILTPKTFAINKNVMFCTNHYKQLFATKGNYDEGFGHDQHKKRWKSEPNLADDEQQSNSTETTQH